MGVETLRAAALATLALLVAGCAEETATPATPTPGSPTPPVTPPAIVATPAPAAPEPSECVSQKSATRAAQPTWLLNTSWGDIRVTLFCDKVPITAQNIVTLTERGVYDGTQFHRVVDDFIVQGGDPLTKDESQRARWGTGDAGYKIQDEFHCADGTVSHDWPAYCPTGVGLHHDGPGVASMANSGRAQSGGSQFFLTAGRATELDNKHPIFGRATDDESLRLIVAMSHARTWTIPPHQELPDPAILVHRATIEWS